MGICKTGVEGGGGASPEVQTDQRVSIGDALTAKFRAAWEASRGGGLVGTIDLALRATYAPETISEEVASKCVFGDNRANLVGPIEGLVGGADQMGKLKRKVWFELRNGDYAAIFREGTRELFGVLARNFPESQVCIWTESTSGRRLEQLAKAKDAPVGNQTMSTAPIRDGFGGINLVAIEKKGEQDKVNWVVDKAVSTGGEILVIEDKPGNLEKTVAGLEAGGVDLKRVRFVHLLQGRANASGKIVAERYPGQILRVENVADVTGMLTRGELGKPGVVAIDMDDTLTDDDRRLEVQAEMFAQVVMAASQTEK